MGEDVAHLSKHVAVSRDQAANADSNPIYTEASAAESATIAANQAALVAELQGIFGAVDGLELSADNININLNDVEVLIAATNSAIAALEAANDLSGDDIVTELQTCCTTLSNALTTLQTSNETHSDEVKAAVVSLEAAVAAFNLAFDNRDLATETTLADLLASTGDETDLEATGDGSVIAILKRIRTRLDQSITDFNAEDFASETTLAAFKAANNADILALKAANDASGDDIVTAVQALEAASDASGDDIVTAINTCCATLEASLTAIEADIEAFKLEAHADSLDTQAAIDELKAVNQAEFDATQAAIASLETALDDNHTSLTNTLNGRSYEERTATEDVELSVDELKAQNLAKHDAIIAELQDIEADIEAQSTQSSLDLQDIEDAVDELKAQSLSESNDTQSRIGEVSATPTANTLLGRLKDIYESVDGLELSVDNIDIDMEVIGEVDDLEATGDGTLIAITKRIRTLALAISDFLVAEDFASETTLAAFKAENNTNLNDLEADIEAFKAEAHADSLDEQAATDELKAQNLTQHGLIIGELQDVEADIEALTTQHLSESNDTQARIGEISATPTVNTVMDRLKNIYEAVDGLELSVDNIDLDMDDVEALLTQIDVVLDDINDNKLGEEDASSVGSVIARINDLQVNLAAFRSENNTNLNDIEASVDAFKAAFDARDLATETTLAAFAAANEASLTAIEADIEAQPTQAQQTADLQDIEDAVDELKAQNLAQHTAVNASLDDIELVLEDVHDDASNALRVTQDTHDELNVNANMQIGDADIDDTNPVPFTPSTKEAFTLIKNNNYLDDHVVLRDFDFAGGAIYIAYADASGGDPSEAATVWNVLREPLVGGLPVGPVSVLEGVTWSGRAGHTYKETVA